MAKKRERGYNAEKRKRRKKTKSSKKEARKKVMKKALTKKIIKKKTKKKALIRKAIRKKKINKRIKILAKKIKKSKKIKRFRRHLKRKKTKKTALRKKSIKKIIKRKIKHKKKRKAEVSLKISSIKRIPIGIPNFDRLIEGGFEKNSTNLLVGSSGSGKSIFAAQFLVEAMDRGEKCLYITFEEDKEQFYENMRELGWDLKAYEKKGLLTFLEYSPIKVKTMLEEGGGTIESIILKNKISRMVIDSITSFALLFEDELSKREAALSLFGLIRDWSCTALLTLEEEPLHTGGVSSSTLEFESDSIIVLYYIRGKEKRERYLEIVKMRGTKHSKNIYQFEIKKGGIFIKKEPVKNFLPEQHLPTL